MIDGYVCPQCGAIYDEAGKCETCHVAVQAPDEKGELEGFQTDDEVIVEEAVDGDEEEEGYEEDMTADDEDLTVRDEEFETDSYEDQDNY